MLTHLRLAGILARAAAIVVGELPGCDEPTGLVTARQVIEEIVAGFPGPVLCGFPSGHTLTPLVSMPLGVRVRVIGAPPGRVVFEEAAAA
jgi:muramoyltetrapeptide carboxypeptidase LdcA involved in peptidoglycan recycling